MCNMFDFNAFLAFLVPIVCLIKQAETATVLTSSIEVPVRNCEPIRIELCRGIGYNETSMPNLVGHEMQSDADFTLQTFLPLIQYGCSAQLHFFLCAAYLPMCTPKVPVPIGPCRGLCETVRARCHPVLQGFGFPWPTALDCNRFPADNNHEHMCMEGPGEPGDSGPVSGSGLNSDSNAFAPPSTKLSSRPFTCQGLTKAHLYVRLNRSSKCAPLCEADILFDQHEKGLAEIWVTVWSVTALVTAVVATLCLIVTDTKWDRILMPLVTCHSLVAVGWTVRWLAGRNPTACGFDPQLPGVSLLLTDGLSNAPCAVTFLLRYYFGMAASAWWAILCLKWHFAIRRSRSDCLPTATILGTNPTIVGNGVSSSASGQHDHQHAVMDHHHHHNHQSSKTSGGSSSTDAYSSLTQLAAWGVPAIQTVTVLVARLVDADELLGACFVGNQSDRALRVLVAMPLFTYWIFGSVNLFAGYLVQRSRYPVQTAAGAPQHHNPSAGGHHQNGALSNNNVHHSTNGGQSSTDTVNGMGAFLFIYCVPSALMMIAVFYEFANRDIWLNDPQPSREPTSAIRAPMWPFMLRAFMELLVGVLASGWTVGPRMSTIWKSRFGATARRGPPLAKKTKSPPIQPVMYPQSAYSTASYQTVMCPQNSMVSVAMMPKHGQKYPPAHVYRKTRGYKTSSQSVSLTGNETML